MSPWLEAGFAASMIAAIAMSVRPAGAYDPAASGATAGMAAAHAAAAGPGKPDFGEDLDGWVDERFGTSSSLASGCGHVAEVRLRGTQWRNYATLTVKNETDRLSTLDPSRVRVRFASGAVRFLEAGKDEEIQLEPSWLVTYTLGFPDKRDFENVDEVVVEIPVRQPGVEECVIAVQASRREQAPVPLTTYVRYAIYELYLGGGARVAAFGGLGELDDVSGFFTLGIGGYPGARHGFFFDLLLQGYGDAKIERLSVDGERIESGSMDGVGVWGGYSVRAYPLSWLPLTYSVGPGVHVLRAIDESGEEPEIRFTSPDFSLFHRVRADAVASLGSAWLGASASVFHFFVPAGKLGNVDASGHGLGAGLMLTIAQ